MQNIFNKDFQDFIIALNQNDVDYLLVGGYSVILHGYNRTTGDMDLWVFPSKSNYQNLVNAFNSFGMPMFDMSLEKFLDFESFDVFRFGVSPVAIEIITQIKGLRFEDAIKNSRWFELSEDLKIRTLSKTDLLKAKAAVGRFKDLDDIEKLS